MMTWHDCSKLPITYHDENERCANAIDDISNTKPNTAGNTTNGDGAKVYEWMNQSNN